MSYSTFRALKRLLPRLYSRQAVYCVKNVSCSFLRTSSASNFRCFYTTVTKSVQREVDNELPKEVKDCFAHIETVLNKKKRLHYNDVQQLLTTCQQYGGLQFSSVFLLNCCGDVLVDYPPEKKIKFAQELLDIFKVCNIRVEESHYRALVKCYLQNRHHVDPKEILNKLKEVGIDPGEELLNLLLQNASEAGDRDEMSFVLSELKSKGFPATETVFCALIYGHAKAGDVDGADQLWNAMGAAKVQKTELVHVTLLRVAALKGDLTMMMDVYKAAQKGGFAFSYAQLYDVIETLAVSGHYEAVDKFIGLFPSAPLPVIENAIYKLMYMRHDQLALKLLTTFPVWYDYTRGHIDYFFIGPMIHTDRPPEDIITVAKELVYTKTSERSLHKLALCWIEENKIEQVLKVYKAIKEVRYPLRTHYFWPLLVQSSKTRGVEGTCEILKQMKELGVEIDEETIKFYILPQFTAANAKEVLHNFTEYFASLEHSILCHWICSLILCEKGPEAADLCETFKTEVIHMNSREIETCLVKTYPKTFDNESTVRILSLCKDFSLGLWLHWLMSYGRSTVTTTALKKLLACFEKREEFRISLPTKVWLINKMKEYGHDISDELKKIARNDVSENVSVPFLRKMNIEELENFYKDVREKNDPALVRPTVYYLLLRNSEIGNVERVHEIQEECHKAGVQISFRLMQKLFSVSISRENVEESLRWYYEIKRNFRDCQISTSSALHFSELLIKSDMYDTALEVLKSHAPISGEKDLHSNKLGARMIKTASETLGPASGKRLADVLIKKGYCTPCSPLFEDVIRGEILTHSLKQAVEHFLAIAETYKVTSAEFELMAALLNGQKKPLLAKVLKAVEEIHGAENLKVLLALGHAHSGSTRKIKSFIKKNEVDFSTQFARRQCWRLVALNEKNTLKNLIAAISLTDAMEITLAALKCIAKEDGVAAARSYMSELRETGVNFPQSISALFESDTSVESCNQ